MKNFILLLIVFASAHQVANCQSSQWAGTSELNNLTDEASAIDMDNSGNKYVGGYFIDSIIINGITYSNNYNVGYGCAFVAKYDMNGNCLWVKVIESASSNVVSLKVNKITGECFVQGKFNGDLYIDGALQSIAPYALYTNGRAFITKLDTDGNLIWVNIVDAGFGVYSGNSIAIAPNGNSIYVAYSTIDAIYFQTGESYPAYAYTLARMDVNDGHLLAVRTDLPLYLLDAEILFCDKEGNVILAGSSRRGSMNEVDAVFPLVINPTFAIPQGFVWKMDPNFASIWGKEISGVGSENVSGVGSDGSGNVYIYGTFDTETTFDATIISPVVGAFNAFVAKITPSGTYTWIKQLSASGGFLNLGNDIEAGFAVDKSGNSYLGGGFAGLLIMGNDTIDSGPLPVYSSQGYLIKLNKNGNVRWMEQMKGTGSYVTLEGISVLDDDIAICGRYPVTVTIGDEILNSDYVAFYAAGLQDCDINIATKSVPGTNKLKVPLVAGDTYQWYETTFGLIPGATNNIYKAVHPGTYYCLVTRGVCTIQSTNQIVLRMAHELTGNNDILIYPNPAHDAITISIADDLENQSITISIIDLLGRTVQQENLTGTGNGEINLNLNSNVVNGTYFIHVSGIEINYSETFIVQ